MKATRIALAGACLLFCGSVSAQWTEPAADTVSTTDKVGIGVTNPSATLEVMGNVVMSSSGGANPLVVRGSAAQNTVLLLQSTSASDQAAAVFRTQAPGAVLNVISHATARTLVRFGQPLGGWTEMLSTVGNGLMIGTFASKPLILGTDATARVTISGGGVDPALVSIAADAHVDGDLTVTGTLTAPNQDVAEWVDGIGEMAAGTVVIIAPDRRNHVTASTREYDTRVAGVVSSRPGLILGRPGPARVIVATTGRVRVRADATAAPNSGRRRARVRSQTRHGDQVRTGAHRGRGDSQAGNDSR